MQRKRASRPGWVVVELDADVFAELQKRAEAIVDTPNSVLRRLFGLGSEARETAGSDWHLQGPTPRGSLLPANAYEVPLLRILAEAKQGYLGASEAIAHLGEVLGDQLKVLDREPLQSGEPRWADRAHHVRQTLIRKGDMAADAPRGVWQITDQGRRRAAEATEESAHALQTNPSEGPARTRASTARLPA